MQPKLSILIPSIPSRLTEFLIPLICKIEKQISKNNLTNQIEILVFADNKMRSIGLKRDALIRMANGQFVVMIDDDDDVFDNFVPSIIKKIDENLNVDLIIFKQQVTINDGNPFTVTYSLNYENEQCSQIDGVWQDIKRKPFHNLVWKTSIALSEKFPDASYGEDYHWAKRLHPKVKQCAFIDEILTLYRYNDKVTEAELIFPEEKGQ